MQINVIGRHWHVPDDLREYILKRVEKLPRLYDRIMGIEVIIDGEGPEGKVECIVSVASHPDFVSEEKGRDLFACFDTCLDKIETQLRKFKDKIRNRKHNSPEK